MSVLSPSSRARVRSSIETPVANVFGRLGLTPNALTLIGFGIALVGAWLASRNDWITASLVVAFGAIFDLFDGALARATNKVSKFGAFMDSTFDRAGEAVVYVGIAIGLLTHIDAQGQFRLFGLTFDGIVGPVLAMIAMAAAFMVSYTRAKSESLGFSSGTGMANIGFAPREVRTVILTLGLFVAGIFEVSQIADFPAGVIPAPQMWWIVLVGALGLIAVLATVTTIQRIFFVYRQSKSTNQEVTK
ncbi:MAG: CDP-alcohol phosphatidyltransferase family protein [Candidatus Limnocylindrales bacterium]